MQRNLFSMGRIAAIGALLAITSPARAIVYGELDGDAHPNVGSIVVDIPPAGTFPGVLVQWCSGTLIADDVFLTASHCLRPFDFIVLPPGARVVVTFDPTISRDGTFYTGQWFVNPQFGTSPARSDTGDVGVFVLDESPGITPARLPTAGLLDELHADHVLDRFTAVGFGTIRTSSHTAFQAIEDNADRNRAEQTALSLTPAWLTLAMTPSNGNGGTCFGDSGGPHFVHIDGVETDIVASVTVVGDRFCKATDKTYRMDTAAARDFLANFVDLP